MVKLGRSFHSTSLKLTALYLALFTVSVTLLFGLTFFNVRSALHSDLEKRIRDEVTFLMFEYKEDGLSELMEEIEERIEKNPGEERLKYFLKHPNGKIVFDSIDNLDKPFGWSKASFGMGKAEDQTEILLYTVSLNKGYVLGVAGSRTPLLETERTLMETFLWALVATIFIGGAGGFFLSQQALKRVRQMVSAAERIGKGGFEERIHLSKNGDEMDTLAEVFNKMLDRIELLIQSSRNVTTSIAHDLRTPLSHLRQKIENISKSSENVKAYTENAIEDIDEILAVFTAILNISEIESRSAKSGFTLLNFSQLVSKVIDFYQPAFEEVDGSIEANIASEIWINADKHLIQQMLSNLFDNVLYHSGMKPKLLVNLKNDTNEGVRLTIGDRGPGVDENLRKEVFKPFYRVRGSEGNASSRRGLGLSLVAAICLLHEIEISLEDHSPGLKIILNFSGQTGTKTDPPKWC